MNGGQCSTCRREKYCHTQCRENKDLLRRIAIQVYREKMAELMARNQKKEDREDEQVNQS